MTISTLEQKAEKEAQAKQQTGLIVTDGKGIVAGSPADLIIQAIHGQSDLEKIEKLLELQERWEANEARKAYHEAMSIFKKNPPSIGKDRKVEYKVAGGTTRYFHASLANVTEKINSALAIHGLSASWVTNQVNNVIKVTCKITHKLGHSETTELSAMPDTSGAKNSIQAIGSTVSYLERYTVLALTGLATHEMDTDATIQAPIAEPQEKKPDAPIAPTEAPKDYADRSALPQKRAIFDVQCFDCKDLIKKGDMRYWDEAVKASFHFPNCNTGMK